MRIGVGRVAVLVGHEDGGVVIGQGLRQAHGAVRAFRARGEDDLRAEEAQELLALRGRVVGHDDAHRVTHPRADHRQADAGVAARRLQDRLALAQRARGAGFGQHPQRDAVLHRAGRIRALQLGVETHIVMRGQPRQLDHGRLPDRRQDVACRLPPAHGWHRSSWRLRAWSPFARSLRPWRAAG